MKNIQHIQDRILKSGIKNPKIAVLASGGRQ